MYYPVNETDLEVIRQRAMFLSEFQRFWVSHGVNLTDPSLQGVDLDEYKRRYGL